MQNSARIIVAGVLILTGVLALMGMSMFWPMFVIVPGLLFLVPPVLIDKPGPLGALVVPGTILVGTGVLLLFQNLTGYWESWTFAWVLYGVFAGVGIWLMGALWGNEAFVVAGSTTVKASLWSFFALAVLVEIIIGAREGIGMIPPVLVLVGAYLVLRSAYGAVRPKRKRKNDDVLFTGPIVYGSRAPSPPSDRDS